MNYFIIGIGGCGNKIVSQGVEAGIISKSKYLLMNSTDKDIPAGYKAIVFSENKDYGCAKNRAASKSLIINWLQNGGADELADTIDETVDCVIIVNSTEGGTGSGAADIICKYLSDDLDIPSVINIPVFGFSESSAGCSNSLKYLKDISENISVLPVSNQKAQKTFDNVGVNTFKTESQVNKNVLEQIKAIIGQDIKPSEQNIDDADHLAIIGNPGLMFITTIDLTDIRDIKTFNNAIIESIAHSISFDIDPTLATNSVKMGIYLNITDARLDYIGNDFSVLKKRLFGDYVPSSFMHKQYHEEYGEFARIIVSGLDIPISEAEKLKAAIDTAGTFSGNSSSSFYDQIQDVVIDETENTRKRKTRSGGSFLDSLSTDESDKEAEHVLSMRGGRSRRRGSNSGSTAATTSSPVTTSTTAQAPATTSRATDNGSPLVGRKVVVSEKPNK